MPTLDWIGKNKVINHHQEVPYRVLERQYSYDTDGQSTEDNGSENMVIHGDNLEALKSLLPRYEGKIKCIYIDPPYNTGNEHWVYNDNVNDPKIQEWINVTVGVEGTDLSRHDKWLCMMYPRLKLLQKLLAEDGAVFISIDDNEQSKLRFVCDEIFGSNNFIAQILVKRQGGRQDSKYYAVVHEYCICYAKRVNCFEAGVDIKDAGDYPKFDEEKNRFYKTQLLRKWGNQSRREDRPNLYYPITAPDGSEVYPIIYERVNGEEIEVEGRWRWKPAKMEDAIRDGKVEFVRDAQNNWIPYEKVFAPEDGEIETKKFNTWQEDTGNGAKILKQIFGEATFDYPKSVNLIELILKMANCDQNSTILDSFAGSGTTAHAVLNMNKADGGNRKFILVELMDYADSITAERVKRVIKGYGEGNQAVEGTGGDFSYYELGEPLLIGENINENVGIDKIREYIWYMETRQPFSAPEADNPYYLGSYNHTDYYFNYAPDRICVLDHEFMKTITKKAESYMIYADRCSLSNEELAKFSITFKKIPRDITRL